MLIFQSATLRSLPPFFVTHLLTVARKNTQLDSHVSLSLAVSRCLCHARAHTPPLKYSFATPQRPPVFFPFFVVSTCIFQRKHWRGQTQAKPHYNYIYIHIYSNFIVLKQETLRWNICSLTCGEKTRLCFPPDHTWITGKRCPALEAVSLIEGFSFLLLEKKSTTSPPMLYVRTLRHGLSKLWNPHGFKNLHGGPTEQSHQAGSSLCCALLCNKVKLAPSFLFWFVFCSFFFLRLSWGIPRVWRDESRRETAD